MYKALLSHQFIEFMELFEKEQRATGQWHLLL